MTMLIIFALAALTALPLFFLIAEIVLFVKAKDDAKRKKLKIAIIITSIITGVVLLTLILLAGLLMTSIMYM